LRDASKDFHQLWADLIIDQECSGERRAVLLKVEGIEPNHSFHLSLRNLADQKQGINEINDLILKEETHEKGV